MEGFSSDNRANKVMKFSYLPLTSVCALSLVFSNSCSEKSGGDSSEKTTKAEAIVLEKMPEALNKQTYFLVNTKLEKKGIAEDPEFYLLYYTASW